MAGDQRWLATAGGWQALVATAE